MQTTIQPIGAPAQAPGHGLSEGVDVIHVTRIGVEDYMDPSRGILGTARTASGAPAMKITDDTVVTVQGIEMRVADAERLGYNVRGQQPQGSQPITTNAPQEVPPTGPVQETAPAPLPLAQGAQEALARLQRDLPGSVADTLVATVINGGTVHQDMAVESGIADPDGFVRDVGAVVEGLRQQGAQSIASLGADPQHFVQWAERHAAHELRDAMRQHVHSGNPHVYAQLVDRYFRATPPDAETLKAGGLDTFANPANGETMVRIGGMEVQASVAARMGLI